VKKEILKKTGYLCKKKNRKSRLMATDPVLEDNNLETFYHVWLNALV
jgi:hypothetical protein